MNTLDLLVASREYATDPNHIVCEPWQVREGERGCLVGIVGIVAVAHGASREVRHAAMGQVARAVESRHGSFHKAMTAEHTAKLEVYDAAIAAEAVKVTTDPSHVHGLTR
jgi:hypothetical protein